MNREDIFKIALEYFGVEPDYPWSDEKYKDAAVLRHKDNKKWFGLIMTVSGRNIGREENQKFEILNLKTEPEIIFELSQQKGVIPAYHMNKPHWLSLILSEVDRDLMTVLLEKSFHLTEKRSTCSLKDS